MDDRNVAFTPAFGSQPEARTAGLRFNSDVHGFIAAQTERHRASGAEQPTSLALTDFAQVIFNLNEFIYVD